MRNAPRAARRLPWIAVVAMLLAGASSLVAPTAHDVAAAGDGLVLTANADYTIVPASRVVRTVVDVTARNNKPNVSSGGVVTRYFYDGLRIGVQPEARNIRATARGARLVLTTTHRDGFTTVEVRFRASLFYRQVTTVRVTYDLPGGTPRSRSEIRVGPAFATFVAWAFGDGGAVRVTVPPGFDAETTGATVAKATTAAGTVFTASAITDVGAWYLVVNADRKTALTNSPVTLVDGERVNVRAWPEDPEWKREVTDLLTRGLPALVDETGLDWPVEGELSIFEVHTPLLEGYAGIFFEGEDKIEISEDLDDLTIVHEASHAWFNGALFDGRWINEGLADTYASAVLGRLGQPGWAPDPVDPTQTAAVPLNAWRFPGRITDDETNAREAYGYNAAWTVVRSIVNEIGVDGMRRVLDAAEARTIPYVGAATAEDVTGPADWRRLLDLVDEAGGARNADREFERWVATPDQVTLLRARSAARATYADLVRRSGDWKVPLYVRSPMATWAFDQAGGRMDEARAVLAKRDELAATATRLGVAPPLDGRTAYQTARDSLGAARDILDREIASGVALEAAAAAVAAPRDAVASIGLIGQTPDALLAGARAAFSQGAQDAAARAQAVSALMLGAADVGRGRLVLGFGLVAVLVVLVAVAAFVVRTRRRRRPPEPVAAVSYATLAAPATPPEPATDRGDASLTEER